MATITAADVKKLRDATGAGMMDCKKALTEADGDYDKAVEILRVTGQAKAAKRGAERSATNGLVAFDDGALLQLGAETDFVAKNEEFQALAADAVKAVAASKADRCRGGERRGAAVRPDRRRGRRGARGQDRREARGQQRRLLRRQDRGLPAQAGLRPAAAGRRAGRVRGLRRDRGPRRGDADRRDASAVPAAATRSRPTWWRTSAGSPRPRPRRRTSRSRPSPKIVEGRVNAFFKDVALLDQPSVTDNKTPVGKQSRRGRRHGASGSSGSRPPGLIRNASATPE